MKTKVLIITMICFLVMGIQKGFAQEIRPFERTQEYSAPAAPSTQSSSTSGNPIFGYLRSDWGGGDAPDPNKPSTEGEAPVSGGLWLLAGLTIAYGFVCRRRKEEK